MKFGKLTRAGRERERERERERHRERETQREREIESPRGRLSPKTFGGFSAFVVKLQGQVLMDLNGSLCMATCSNSTYTKGMLSGVGATLV